VDLTEDGVMEPYEHLLGDEAGNTGRAAPNYHRFAIPDVDIVSDEGYAKILAHLRTELDAGKGVYVHCWGGKGRTSTVIGCWLTENGGLDYETALQRMNELRAATRKAHDPVSETPAQRDVLRRWAARTRTGIRRRVVPESFHSFMDRFDGLSDQEKAACRIVELASGAVAHAWDIDGREGAVDAMLTLADGRRGALEITTLSADGAIQTEQLLARDGHSWPLPGNWWWTISVGSPGDIP
jgi:hypothetical protein